MRSDYAPASAYAGTAASGLPLTFPSINYDALIEAAGWPWPRRFTATNQAGTLHRFRDYLRSLAHPVHIAFEAADDRGLAPCLLETGFYLHLVSALTLARTREALHNSSDKKDPRDAQLILHLLRNFRAAVRGTAILTAGC